MKFQDIKNNKLGIPRGYREIKVGELLFSLHRFRYFFCLRSKRMCRQIDEVDNTKSFSRYKSSSYFDNIRKNYLIIEKI